MAQQHERQETRSLGATLPAYRWIATIFAALVILQAFLGTRGFFADPDLITMHEILANAMFLFAIGMVVLAWLLYTKRAFGMPALALNGLLVVLTIAQIGLGYVSSTGDNFATTISLHIPNGVLLMGVSAIIAAAAWRIDTQQAPVEAYS